MRAKTTVSMLLFGCLLVSGCASNIHEARFDVVSANFVTADSNDLCIVYGFRANRSAEARRELVRREVFTKEEWDAIDEKKVSVGMKECAVKAAWPHLISKAEFSQDKAGKVLSKTSIFSCDKVHTTFCPNTKVQLIDGIVVSIAPAN